MSHLAQIRSNTKARIFLLEALVVVYSFTAAAFRSDWPSISHDPGALGRLAIPAAAALFGLLLRDAYTGPDRPPHASVVDVIVAFALAFLSEMVLSVLKPELMLPRWAPTQGGFVGISLLVACRSLFPPCAKLGETAGPLSQLEIRWKAEELGKSIRYSAQAYFVISTLFSSIALWFILAGSPKARAASCLLLAGTVYLVYQIRERGWTATTPYTSLDSYRRELHSQRGFLQSASYWYYGSLLPAVLLSLLGHPVYPYWIPLVVLVAAELNHREAEKVRQELDELNAPRI